MSFVENLRSKSEKQKKKIMVVSLVISMLLMSLVWFFQFKMSPTVGNKMDLSEILDIKDDVVGAYNDSVNKINDLKKGLEGLEGSNNI
jgi:hypothetical protein